MLAAIALAFLLHAGQAAAGGYGPAYGPPGMGYGPMGYAPMGYGFPMPHPRPGYAPPAYGPQGQGMPAYGPIQAPRYGKAHNPAAGGGQAGEGQAASRPLAGAASAEAAASGGGGRSVTVSGMRFSPATITVKPGETVTWDFIDGMPHTVTSRGGEFASSRLSGGESYGHTFHQPGEYAYFCSLHPSMVGKVVVTE